ncbi:hypothetical protein F7725_012227, partial [Dissostichus mawsoni]
STEETGASSSAVANASHGHTPGGAVDKLDPTPNVLGFDEPCRPDISFPARKIGTETFERCFTRWKWVHYVTEKDTVLCFTCCKAIEKGLRHNDRKTSSFTVGGFCNWRKATTKFSQHELADIHSESERMLASLLNTPLMLYCRRLANNGQNSPRANIQISKIHGSLGLSLRGHNNRDGVLWKLMMERTFTLPKCREWLQRRDNWMSDTVQNEILEIFAHAVQREIVSEAREHSFYGLTADATTDISTSEQFSITLQYVDSKLEAVNAFLGFYSAPDSTGETLFSCIKDVFLRLNLPLERLRGFCFDGAANVSGRISGVQAKLKEQCPSALYVHCSNHALDLVLQEVAREVRVVADTLNFVRSVSVVVGESSKRKMLFQSMFGDDEAALFGPCETVARALQSEKASAKGALECVSALRQRMHGLREDGFIQEMTAKVTACAERNNLKMPLPPRTNRTPARLRDTEETEAIVTDVESSSGGLDRRFDQEGLQVAALREQTVINAANGEYSGMREITAAQVPDQFDKSRLHMQLTLLGNLSKTKGLKTAQDVAGFIGALHPQTRELLTEVEKLIELCLCLPVSAASSERSFSTLRRLKTWLRSNMTQRRLTHLAVMHVHSDILDRMDIQPLMKRLSQHP